MHFRHLAFAVAWGRVIFTAMEEITPSTSPPPEDEEEDANMDNDSWVETEDYYETEEVEPSPIPPPEGWEERVTPGYDPSVELVVIGDSVTGASARAGWHYWDEGAVDVLLRLLDDPHWRDFRESVLQVLAASPCPRAVEWVDARLRELIQCGDLSDIESNDLRTLLYCRLSPFSPGTEEYIALCIGSGNEVALTGAIHYLITLRTPDTHARASEAIGLINDAERSYLTSLLDLDRGCLRAMESVLPQLGKPEPRVAACIADEVPAPRPFTKGGPAGASISGHVKTGVGNASGARISVGFEGHHYSFAGTGNEEGAFIVKWLPPGPFFLEIMAPGHQARLLASGRDFNVGDRDLVIELTSGSFDGSAPVWMQAAGFRTEDEALQYPELARVAKFMVREYITSANKAPVTTEPPVMPVQPPRAHICVTDAGNHPVQQITVQAAEQSCLYVPTEAFQPAHGSVPQIMTSETGQYTVPNPCLVDAEGCAQQVVKESSPLPLELKMTPPASLVIEVQNYHGKPVVGAQVTPPGWIWELAQESDWLSPLVSPPSDDQGRIVIDGLQERTHGHAIALWGPSEVIPDHGCRPWPPRIVIANLRGGEETVVPVTLPIATGGTIESVLMDWEVLNAKRHGPRPNLGEEVSALGSREQQRLGALVSAQLAQMPLVCEVNWKEAVFFATLASLLRDHAMDAKPALQRLLAGMEPDIFTRTKVAEVMCEAIMTLGGDRDIAYWSELVVNMDVPFIIRLHASAALGRIGTEESISAWLSLLDAARRTSPPKNRLTHADLMAEVVLFAVEGVLPKWPYEQAPFCLTWVDEQRETGWLIREPHQVAFRRHGDEWIITGISLRWDLP